MYIRRKVFSVLQDENGEEKLFSINDIKLIENSIVKEKLYSTGNEELDDLLEKAFSEGYNYAQKEFFNKKYLAYPLAALTGLGAAGGLVSSCSSNKAIEPKIETVQNLPDSTSMDNSIDFNMSLGDKMRSDFDKQFNLSRNTSKKPSTKKVKPASYNVPGKLNKYAQKQQDDEIRAQKKADHQQARQETRLNNLETTHNTALRMDSAQDVMRAKRHSNEDRLDSIQDAKRDARFMKKYEKSKDGVKVLKQWDKVNKRDSIRDARRAKRHANENKYDSIQDAKRLERFDREIKRITKNK